MNITRLLVLTLGLAFATAACGTSASDSAASEAPDTSLVASSSTAEAGAKREVARAKPAAAPAAPRLVYRDVTIPAGTTLSLTLTSSVASDTSDVEDAVTADLTRPITIDGREVLPAGAKLSGVVTEADDAGHVKGRAQVGFRFTSLRTGNERYDVQSATVSRRAPATKGEDATKIGIGAGAGAIIGGLLGGKDGAAKGAVVGGGAGTGVVLATKGKEVRLGPGADITTQLTAPLTIRVRRI